MGQWVAGWAVVNCCSAPVKLRAELPVGAPTAQAPLCCPHVTHTCVSTLLPACLLPPSCLPCSGFGIGVMLLAMVMLCCHKRLLPRLEKVRPPGWPAWLSTALA